MFDWLFGQLLSIIRFDYRNRRQKDRALLKEFLITLPSDSDAIRFLGSHDMGSSIPISYLSQLNQLVDSWRGPDREFQVTRVERKKVKFIDSLQRFLSHYEKHSAGKGGGLVSIGLRDWEDRPEMLKYKCELEQLAIEAHKKYTEFISLARKEV